MCLRLPKTIEKKRGISYENTLNANKAADYLHEAYAFNEEIHLFAIKKEDMI